MDVQKFKSRLLDMERQLSAKTDRERGDARSLPRERPGDAGDDSVREETESEEFTEGEHDAAVLQQVREALLRIGDGTFGHCVVDGEPIEAARLEAVPWTPYCRVHQEEMEGPVSPGPTM